MTIEIKNVIFYTLYIINNNSFMSIVENSELNTLARVKKKIKDSIWLSLLGGLAVPLLLFSITSLMFGPGDILTDSLSFTYIALVLGLVSCIGLTFRSKKNAIYGQSLQLILLCLWISLAVMAMLNRKPLFYGSLGTSFGVQLSFLTFSLVGYFYSSLWLKIFMTQKN